MKNHLTTHLPTFAPPSKEGRQAFDSSTAAINVTPSTSHQYGIEKIKDNALWLSKEANISETEALRLTLLEWQYRPEARLEAGFSDAELASLRDLFGAEYCEGAGMIQGSSLNRSETSFDSEDGTRTRLLQLNFHERARLLAVSRQILELHALSELPDANQRSRSRHAALPQAIRKAFHDFLADACHTIETNVEALQADLTWSLPNQYHAQVGESSVTSNLQCIALTLDIVLLISTQAEEAISADRLLQWLRLMQSVDHFNSFNSDVVLQQTVIEHIRTVSACATLSILQPTNTLLQLTEHPETRQGSYIYEYGSLTDIHDIFVDFAITSSLPASPAVLAWGLLLVEIRNLATYTKETSDNRAMQRAIDKSSPQDVRRSSISSAGSSHQSVFEDILREITPVPNGEDAPDFLLTSALQGMSVLDYVSQIIQSRGDCTSFMSSATTRLLQDLVKQALPILEYGPELLSTQNTILALPRTTRQQTPILDPAVNFIGDSFLMESVFDVAAARFPYEALPLLRLCRTLALANIFDDDGTQYIAFRLRQLDSFTQLAMQGFASYQTIREDENANLVSLDNAVGICDFQQHKLLTQEPLQSSMLNVIPARAVGEVISNAMPPVIKWQHTFSGLALLGKWIELHRAGLLGSIVSPFEKPDDVVAEAIWMLAALLKNTFKHALSAQTPAHARQLCDGVVEECSTLLQGDADLVGCVFELAEHQLQAGRGQTPSIAARDLLTACVDLIVVYSEIHPSRTWPSLLRSSIFGMSGTKKNVMSIIGTVELPLQAFGLLESCSELFNSIIHNALPLAIQSADTYQSIQLKKARVTASQRLNGSAISQCAEVMLSALEAMGSWAFRDPMQKQRIFANITAGFYDIISYAFGTGETHTDRTPVKTSFMPAATALTEALQNPGFQTTGAGPLLQQLLSAVSESSPVNDLGTSMVRTASTIELLSLLLRYAQISSNGSSEFAQRLLNLMPILARLPLHQSNQSQRTNKLALSILKTLPPCSNSSILGHLGAASSVSWIDILRHSCFQPLRCMTLPLLWEIYSQLVTINQQWLAIVLVTGAAPGRQRKEGETPTLQTQGKPCIQHALEMLSRPHTVDSATLAALLDFLLEAQRNWPSVSDTIAARSELFPELISWVCRRDVGSRHEVSQALHNKVAALVTELTVLHMHRLMSMKDERVFSVFIPLLKWLAENAIGTSAYNTSLHVNLKRNFTKKYPTLDAMLFRHSGLVQKSYGSDFFFDLDIADIVIGDDPFWKNEKTGEQSFFAEFQRANINLSVVDSELALLHSLEYLSIEHAGFFARNRDVARIMAEMINNCMKANSQSSPAEKLFDTVFQTRADLAITLLRPLVAVKARGSDFPALLTGAWDAVRFRNGSYETAIANEDLEYWRSVLSALLMCLQFHVEKKVRKSNVGGQSALVEIDPFNNMYCEIAYVVVGEGLRAVVSAIQAKQQERGKSRSDDTNAAVGAKDVTLLLNILQTILRLPTLPQFTVQLSEALTSTGAAQSCISLYLWSHLLIEGDEPVFADLSIRFLASLSSLTLIAEDLAVEGIFTRLLSAKFTQTLQTMPSGISHLDKRPHGPLMYSVWTHGILPICLSLLHGVGGGVAAEISDFLNRLPAQLNRATSALSGAQSQSAGGGGVLTLPLVTEVATLSLISYILASFRDAGASAGVDPEGVVVLDGFDQNKRSLAEDVRDAIQQDRVDRKRRTIATNETEAKWAISDVLDRKIVQQLNQAQICLRQDSNDDEK